MNQTHQRTFGPIRAGRDDAGDFVVERPYRWWRAIYVGSWLVFGTCVMLGAWAFAASTILWLWIVIATLLDAEHRGGGPIRLLRRRLVLRSAPTSGYRDQDVGTVLADGSPIDVREVRLVSIPQRSTHGVALVLDRAVLVIHRFRDEAEARGLARALSREGRIPFDEARPEVPLAQPGCLALPFAIALIVLAVFAWVAAVVGSEHDLAGRGATLLSALVYALAMRWIVVLLVRRSTIPYLRRVFDLSL